MVSRLNNPDVQIIDARTPQEFTGEDIRAIRGGHIPGAVKIPYEQNWVGPETQTKLARKEVSNNAGMSLKRPADLKQLYSRFDPKKETIVYCQSGARASETAGVLQELGFTNVKIYDSSWLGYGNTLDAPANNVTFFNVGLFNSRLSTLQELVSQLEKGAAGAATLAASGLAATKLWQVRTGRGSEKCEFPDSWNAAKLFARDHLRKNRCTTPKAGLESVAEVVDILSTGNPPPKIDEAVFVRYRLNSGC